MKANPSPARIHLWVPEISGVGGIQQYSRMLLRGLEELLPETKIRVLSKNDLPENFVARENVSLRGTGAVSQSLRTARFCSLLISQTLIGKPDLAILTHLHFAPVAHALKKWTGLRYWVSAHGMEAWGALSPLMEKALGTAERILPVSLHTASRLERLLHRKAAKFFVLPNAVNGENFFPTAKPIHLLRRYGLAAEQKVLFTLARLDSPDRYKGYERVIDALPRLRRSVPGIHYVLAGRGAENERIRRRVRRLGVERQVTLTGFLPDRDLRDHFNLCDLFVMPSQGEGFGIVYLEALACGRPVVAGNQDGSREPLLNGELGVLIDPRDSLALTDAITAILRGQDAGGHGYAPAYLRSRALEHFGFDAFKERLRKLLES